MSLVSFWLVVLLLLPLGKVVADDNSYQIEEISQLDHHDISDKNWQQIVANPSNKEQFFIINDTGQLYLLEDTISAKPLLDFNSQVLKNAKQHPNFVIKSTAIALHPNFSLRDQAGYGTFYTAHLEPINTKSRTKRIQEHGTDFSLKFDSVITEWQFSSANKKKIDVTTQREILRISVPNESFVIKQLSFNPAIKSWNDDFGLLYISLSGDKKWQKPLYSGVILRINPAKFGLRSFTVPKNNPFLKDSQIKDAIYLLGGQHIQQFIWPDKNSEQLLLAHQYNQQELLSLTSGRDDWRVQAPKVLYQSNDIINDVVIYRGRNFPYLRNKLLLLRFKESSWHVESMVFKRSASINNIDENIPKVEWQFTHKLSVNSKPSFVSSLSGEVLILDKNENLLYRLSQGNTEVMGGRSAQAVTESSSGNGFLVFFLFVIMAGAGYYFINRNQFSIKKLVRQQYAHLEVSESEQQIGLYHRHETSADTIIDIANIVSSEVQLNDNCISLINDNEGHGFTNDKEQYLRVVFTKEHIDKMVDGKIRQISLKLTTIQNKSYVICLYIRKGSNRITKKSYFKVVDDLIDWCWLVSKKINAGQTDERKIKTVSNVPTSTVEKEQNATPLHNQAAAIRPAADKIIVEPEPEPEPEISTANVKSTDKVTTQIKSIKDDDSRKNKNTSSTIDTELVNALEKLVSLKQQGFLTTDEFAKAKAKLLKNLFDKQ